MKPQSLSAWLDYIEHLHPENIKLGLERVRVVQSRMGLGQLPGSTIVVGGTNGKGSVVAYLEAIYSAAGYRVGSYTSPHLMDYNERVRLAGQPVSDELLCDAFAHVDAARGDVSLTYFEFGTLAAADILRSAALDVNVLEVGLGGRLDAVNVFDGDVAVITGIAIDHREWLGDNRESIGYEKAGILRPRRPVVCGDTRPPASLVDHACKLEAPLYQRDKDFSFVCSGGNCRFQSPQRVLEGLAPPALHGEYQYSNVASVLMATSCLRGRLPLTQDTIDAGLRHISIAGRFQIVQSSPQVVLDVAHNPQATAALAATCAAMPVRGRTLAVVGMMKDKALAESLGPLTEMVDEWFVADLPAPRGATAATLRTVLRGLRDRVRSHVFPDILSAWQYAMTRAGAGDRVLVFGSFVSVGVILRQFPPH